MPRRLACECEPFSRQRPPGSERARHRGVNGIHSRPVGQRTIPSATIAIESFSMWTCDLPSRLLLLPGVMIGQWVNKDLAGIQTRVCTHDQIRCASIVETSATRKDSVAASRKTGQAKPLCHPSGRFIPAILEREVRQRGRDSLDRDCPSRGSLVASIYRHDGFVWILAHVERNC